VIPDGAEMRDPRDIDTLRYAVRARGDTGFLFLNNYQDHVPTRDLTEVAVSVLLPSGTVRFPTDGTMTLRSGESAILPFNMDIEGTTLVSSTAQPMARIEAADAVHYFFFEHPGMPVYYLFSDGLRVTPGFPSVFARANRQGRRIVFHTLSERQSLDFAVMRLAGRERAVITDAEAFAGDDTLFLRRRSTEPESVDVRILPGVEYPLEIDGTSVPFTSEGDFEHAVVAIERKEVPLDIKQWASGDAEVTLPANAFDGVKEILLHVRYDGDVGNALLDGALVADDFANGEVWEIGLDHLRPAIESRPLSVHITPRRQGSVVFRESGMAAQRELQGKEIGVITSLTAIAVREVILRPGR
jgi:hypothetical protein